MDIILEEGPKKSIDNIREDYKAMYLTLHEASWLPWLQWRNAVHSMGCQHSEKCHHCQGIKSSKSTNKAAVNFWHLQ